MSVSALKAVEPAVTNVPCNLCGADDAEVLFEAGVAQHNQIVACRKCGLMYSNPRIRPADQDLVKDYDPNLTGDPEAYDPGRFDKERVQVRDYADTREYLKKLYPHRGKLIELGCGVGFLLKAFADDGWDVTGIEPDRGFCEYIEKKQGLKALPTILETSGIPDNSVDVVVFLHVIEHVPDPLATLETIFRVLKPGGHLVLETPRYDSLMFKLLGKRERSLSCDGHIYFFTTDTLRKLTEKAGFKTKQWRYVGRSLNLERLSWNVGVISKSKAVQKLLKKTSDLLRFNKLHFKMNMRDMQRIVVQKPA